MRILRTTFLALAVLVVHASALMAAPESTPPQTAPSKPHGHDHAGPAHGDRNDDATAHHPFDDVDRWVDRFDDPDRAAWQKPDEVVKALGLKPGMAVADIGAGTGYFNRFLSREVGPTGKVYAVDVEPKMVEHMKGRAAKETTPNVAPILAAPDDPHLPEGGVDVVMIVNTYHHIDDRLDYFRRLRRSLRPGGRVAVIDFHKRDLPVGPAPEHKLEREFVLGEFETGGWRLVEEPTFLPHQYFLIFEPK